MNNLILKTDSYKQTHWKQYPPNTTKVYSYLESRGGEFDEVMFFGLQYILQKHLVTKVTKSDLYIAQRLLKKHFEQPDCANLVGWKYIIEELGGRLPLVIKSVPEGSVHKPGTVLMTIENTDPKVPWLTNFVESLLMQVWYPCTVGTLSREIKKVIKENLEETADDISGLPFKLHDFGFRGVSSTESAAIGGMAHLVNFMGTDNLAGMVEVRESYTNDEDYWSFNVEGFSIPASEHSTMTSWGQSGETLAYENMLNKYPTGLVSIVSDSFDIYHAVSEIFGKELKDEILQRDGVVVIRPDSGNPITTVNKVIEILGNKFGFTQNKKGYKVLPPQIRMIQGDGIDLRMVKDILANLKLLKWSGDNIAFGSGGGLLQKMNRDTCKFAIKCSWAEIDGGGVDIFKSPVGQADKKSKRGRFDDLGLETIYLDGEIVKHYTFDEVRRNAAC